MANSLAPRKRAPKLHPDLAAARDRIREAERTQAPVTREPIPLTKTMLDTLVVLVERGVNGKKQAVLASALAIGLEALLNIGETREDHEPVQPAPARWGTVRELFPVEPESEQPSALVAAALGGEIPFGRAGSIVRPSDERKGDAGDEE